MKYVIVALLFLAFIVPTVEADGQITNCAPQADVSSVVGLINAGAFRFCTHVPDTVHGSVGTDGTIRASATLTGPAGTSVSVNYFSSVISGCAIGTISQVDSIGTFGTISTAHWNIDLTDGANQCHGLLRVEVMSSSTRVYSAGIPYMIQTETLEIDAQNRLCAASSALSSCVAPTVNNAVSGTMANTVSGTLANTVSGSLNIHQDEACGATIPCLSNQTLQFGNVSTSQNNTLFGDVQQSVKDWVPLLIAFAILALATMRTKPNYLAVIIAGAFFVYAAIFCPFNETTVKLMVALFGLYNALLGSLELYGDKRGTAMEE